MYTHTLATNTERFVITFWREKIIHRFKLQQMVKKKTQQVLIAESFEGDDEKTQYASFKHIFI